MRSTAVLSLDSEVVASPEQASCTLASEAVLLSLRTGEYFGLNEVGARIWTAIQLPRTIASVRDELLAEYDGVSQDVCSTEVLSFLDRMIGLGLVEVR
jgi:hypothetical protein